MVGVREYHKINKQLRVEVGEAYRVVVKNRGLPCR